MKKCTYCGQEYPDDATVCTIDQKPLTPVGQSDAPAPARIPAARTVKPALMTRLRAWHLYLGCIFAPMLLFFAITGIWQTLGIRGTKWMQILSIIHTGGKQKSGFGSNLFVKTFVVLMAAAFVVTIILGILMAVNQGRNRRTAYYCLAFGIIVPLLLVLLGNL